VAAQRHGAPVNRPGRPAGSPLAGQYGFPRSGSNRPAFSASLIRRFVFPAASRASPRSAFENRSQTEPKPSVVPPFGFGPDCARLASLGSHPLKLSAGGTSAGNARKTPNKHKVFLCVRVARVGQFVPHLEAETSHKNHLCSFGGGGSNPVFLASINIVLVRLVPRTHRLIMNGPSGPRECGLKSFDLNPPTGGLPPGGGLLVQFRTIAGIHQLPIMIICSGGRTPVFPNPDSCFVMGVHSDVRFLVLHPRSRR
jgi:hypothetical protein